MDDDAAVDANTPEVQEETPAPAPQAPKPKRKSRAKAVPAEKEPETPRAEREPDPMLFAMLLKTQRAMEKEARIAKLSSLRIV
jgi:hypothetical protein